MSNAIPTVVIVGRPNVGKSTLFNRITGQRRAIVGDEPGITRDRIHGSAEHDGRRFELIDTGGIVVNDQEYIPSQILQQAEVALKPALATSSSWWMGAPKSPAPTATWPDAAAPRQAGFARRQQGRYRGARTTWPTDFTSSASPMCSRSRRSTASASTPCSTM